MNVWLEMMNENLVNLFSLFLDIVISLAVLFYPEKKDGRIQRSERERD